MDDLSRSEYPAILDHLQPSQAVQLLQDRVRRIGKVNQDIADWLQERRRVEEQYVAGLKKLAAFRVPANTAELGVFQPSWDAVLHAVNSNAAAHHQFAQLIEKDVEGPLRAFQTRREMANMSTIAGNLQDMAKELDDAQDKADKIGKKAGKASAQKVDAATQRLEGATQQWESQAPFVFETLQALDEQRVNHLRDVLTQLETHEVDQTSRVQATAEALLNLILEVRTEDEIQTFAQRATHGRARLERRTTAGTGAGSGTGAGTGTQASAARGSSTAGSVSSRHQRSQPPPPPPPPPPPHARSRPSSSSGPASAAAPAASSRDDNVSEHSGGRGEGHPQESKLRSRIGTMLGRRRQSIHSGFGPLSPSKGAGPFNRVSLSSHGRAVSPRASSNNLAESNNHRLSSLAESPDSPAPSRGGAAAAGTSASASATNGHAGAAPGSSGSGGTTGGGVGVADINTLNHMTVDEIFGVPPPPGPPPSQQAEPGVGRAPAGESARDAEGFSVPPVANDPISQAQRDAANEADQAFKLNIQNEPVQDEDPQAKQAALSNVVSTLSQGMPTRKTGTVRGRRDVRNTIYVPAPPPPAVPEPSSASSSHFPGAAAAAAAVAPALGPASRSSTFASAASSSSTPTRPSAVAALVSESSLAGTSDTQSVRSATSLSSLAHLKHVDFASPGLSTSIIETVSAHFEDGELKSAKMAGEIAFSYTPPADGARDTETIRINNFPLLEVIGPNRIFVQNTAAPDEFTLQTSHLQPKSTVGFTFRAHATDATALAAHCPLVLKPVWKPTGDKLGLLLQYRLNPEARLAQQAGRPGGPVVLRNVVFMATYEGARASGAQTKPTGTHLKDKHLVYWRMAEVTLTDAWSKIVCRIVGEQGAEPQPGHIDVRWEYLVPASTTDDGTGISVSRQVLPSAAKPSEEQDPFADEGLPSPLPANGSGTASWAPVPLARQIVSGKYEAK